MFMEIDAQGWVAIIGAVSAAVVASLGALALVLVQLKGVSQKVDAAASRREEIATAVLNPSTTVQAAPPVSPPKE